MCNREPNFRLLSLFRMRRNFYLWFTLFLFSNVISGNAQKRLIVKVNPEFRSVFENKNSELSRIISNLNLPHPQKKFPSHSPLKKEKNKNGKELVDLSLMYESEIPFPLASVFTLRQIQNRPEIQYAEWEELEAFPLSIPNDPNADSLLGSQRQVLRKIMAYQAWNLSQGDSNVVIGVLDTGVPVDHEDMVNQIKINPLDPPNGLDDDQNGLVDDYQGWDFGSNDNNPTPDNTGTAPGHGTSVASLATASTNNAKGIAGVAYKCKVLPLKIWKWNGNFSNFKGYDAIVYAADRGCKIINCSWGSARNNRQYEQDIINYATFNKDALVVAAGGNTAGFYNFLPANYDNVFGVTMTDTTDQIFWAASQNFKLDLSAPGVNIFGIQTNGNYGWIEGGSSMASPMVAGAAALVLSKFPQMTGLQAGELLRVNSDTIYSVPGNAGYRYRSGRGRLNIFRALQRQNTISLRPTDIQLRNKAGIAAAAGDTVGIFVRFENFLDSISGFEAKAFSNSSNFQIVENARSYGPLASLKSVVPGVPFIGIVNPNLATGEEIQIRIQVKVGNGYLDDRVFIVHINQPILDLDANLVKLSILGNGRIGSLDISNFIGSGVQFKGVQMFGDGGLMVGTGPTKVSNAVYDTSGNDNHFKIVTRPKFIEYQNITQHAVHHMNDSAAGSARIGLSIKQSSYAMEVDSLAGSVFLNYQITNRNSVTLDSVCIAQYNDWDLENANFNFSTWIDSLRLGYTKGRAFRNRFAGVQLLSQGEPQFYAIEAVSNTNNGNINLFDGFSLAEKWQTMSNGIGRPNAGLAPNGNNVVQVVGAKLRDFLPGETRKVSFAYVFADSLKELEVRAKANQKFWNGLNISPSPTPKENKFCKGDTLSPQISNLGSVKKYQVFEDSIAGVPIYSGSAFTPQIYSDTIFYFSGIDSLLQGPKVALKWVGINKPAGTFLIQPALSGDSLAVDSILNFLATDTNQSFKNRWLWNGNLLSDSSNSLQIVFDSVRIHQICLVQKEPVNNCENQSCISLKVFQPLNTSKRVNRLEFELYPNPAEDELFIKSDHPCKQFQIFNSLGKKVLAQKVESQNFRISVSEFPKGMYTLQLLGVDKKLSKIWIKK